VGFIGPIVAVIYDLGGAGSKITALTLYIGSAFWLLAGIALHLIARAVLGRLK